MAAGEAEGVASPFPIHGNLLEEVLRHLPTVDLVPALYVSTAWRRAVYSSLRSFPRSKPWLFLHVQSRRRPATVATYAYDPHSRSWVWVPCAQQTPVSSALRSTSGSGLMYELTMARLAVRTSGLGAWRELGRPRSWRTDAVVAAVGADLVVVGGVCELLDDPCCVEIYGAGGAGCGVQRRPEASLEPMPEAFRDSASGTWLSAAASDRMMYVMHKCTGLVCSFDLETRRWGLTAELRPDPSIFFSVIGFSRGRLILVGLGRDARNGASLKLWDVASDSLECRLIVRMPAEMLERLADGDESSLTSVDVCAAGDLAYVHNPSNPTSVFSCDFAGDECRWEEVQTPVEVVGTPMDRYVWTCAEVGIDDLRPVFAPAASGNGRRHE